MARRPRKRIRAWVLHNVLPPIAVRPSVAQGLYRVPTTELSGWMQTGQKGTAPGAPESTPAIPEPTPMAPETPELSTPEAAVEPPSPPEPIPSPEPPVVAEPSTAPDSPR